MASTMATDVPHQEEFVNIEWKEYGDALRAGLWKLFAEQHLVDVGLSRCAGLKVHKFILAMFFDGLSTDLSSRLRYRHHGTEEYEIGINDLFGADVEWDAEVVRQLFEFCYSGKISVATHNLTKVLSLAEAVKFRGLVDTIQKHYDCESTPRSIKEELIIEDCDYESVVDQPDIRTSSELPCGGEVGRHDRVPVENGGPIANQPSTNSVDAQKPRKRSSRKGTPVKITYIRQTRSRANQPVEQSGTKSAPKKNAPKKKVAAKRRRKSESSSEEESNSTDDVDETREEPPEDESSGPESVEWDEDEERETSKKIKSTTNNRKRSAGGGGGAGRKRTTTTTSEKYPSGGKKRVRLTCDQCAYTTTDKVTYANHLAKHDPSMDVKRFECDVCSKTFRSRKGFKCHMKTHGDPDEQFQCAQCAFSTPQKWSWRQHMAVMHKLDAESGRELIANFRCEQCDFECVAGHQLKAHLLRKHSLEKQFKCTECTYETIYRSQLEKHVSVSHRKERHYMCEECGFRSQTQSGLTRHKRAHLGIKPFKCHCGMEYADRGKYKTHLLRHTNDEKPFVCHVCAHSCRRRDNLRMHLKRIHNLSLDNHNAIRPFGTAGNGQEQIASEAVVAVNTLRPDGGDDGIRTIDSPTLPSYY